jgi:drug/metabolite transporter (DMT)-like permease
MPLSGHSRRPSAEIMLLLVAAVWGGSYSVAKHAMQHLPALEFLALRFGLTFVLLLPTLKPLFGASGFKGLQVGCILGANLLAIFLCETFGVTLTSAANAAFLVSLCLALTPPVEWWLLKKKPPSGAFLAAGLSLLGAALLVSTRTSAVVVGWGDALMVLAALLRALMVCQTKRLAPRHQLPALTLTAVQSGVIAAGAGLLSLIDHSGAWRALPTAADFWWCMAFLVLFCTLFAFFAQNYAASRTSPSRVSLLMGSEPVFGALVAVLWLGESINAWGWLGGLLIVIATAWVAMPLKERPGRPEVIAHPLLSQAASPHPK